VTVVTQEPHTAAVVSALATAGLRVGQGEAPDGSGWEGEPGASTFRAYVVLFPLSGGIRDGLADDPEMDARLLYQATCVASTQPACELLLDRVSQALPFNGSTLTISGRAVVNVRHDFGSAQVRRDDEPEPGEPSLHYATPRFRLWTTPDPSED
jgi:hypothetical protein